MSPAFYRYTPLDEKKLKTKKKSRFSWRWLLILIPIIITIGLQVRFYTRVVDIGTYVPEFILWAVSIVVIFFIFPLEIDLKVRSWKVSKKDLLIGLAILGIALALRLYQLGNIPNVISGDEGRMGVINYETMIGRYPNVFSAIAGIGVMFLHVKALLTQAIGYTNFSFRLLEALSGSLSALVTYFLARQFTSRISAILAGVIVATSHFHLHFSRMAMGANIIDTLFAPLFCLLFLLALKTGRRIYFLLSALCVGLHMYVFQGARLIMILTVAYLVGLAIFKFSMLRANFKNILLFIFTVIVITAPMWMWGYQKPEFFNGRIYAVGIMQNGWLKNVAKDRNVSEIQIIGEQTIEAIKTIYHYPAWGFYDSKLPMMEMVAFSLFVIGMVIVTVKFYKHDYLLLNGYFWACIFGTQALLLTPQANSYRSLILFPLLAVVAAIGFDLFVKIAKRFLPAKIATGLMLLTVVIVASAIAWTNLSYYFGDFAQGCYYSAKGTRMWSRVGEFITTQPKDVTFNFHVDPFLYGVAPNLDFRNEARKEDNKFVYLDNFEKIATIDKTKSIVFYNSVNEASITARFGQDIKRKGILTDCGKEAKAESGESIRWYATF